MRPHKQRQLSRGGGDVSQELLAKGRKLCAAAAPKFDTVDLWGHARAVTCTAALGGLLQVKRQADRLEAQEAAAQEAELLAKVQLEAGQAAGQQRREQVRGCGLVRLPRSFMLMHACCSRQW